jgi:hypothetical protein
MGKDNTRYELFNMVLLLVSNSVLPLTLDNIAGRIPGVTAKYLQSKAGAWVAKGYLNRKKQEREPKTVYAYGLGVEGETYLKRLGRKRRELVSKALAERIHKAAVAQYGSFEGWVAWRQGIGYWSIRPPYGGDCWKFWLELPTGIGLYDSQREAVEAIRGVANDKLPQRV